MILYDGTKQVFLILIMLVCMPFFIKSLLNQYRSFVEPTSTIALIRIHTIITTAQPYIDLITTAMHDDTAALVLLIESRAGAIGSIHSIVSTMLALKKEFRKPIIALIENYCLGTAYWIAAAADSIVAPSTALIGEISPTMITWNIADHDIPESAMTDAFTILRAGIARGRKLSVQSGEWIQGSIVTAAVAKKQGLVDELGSFPIVEQLISKKALLNGPLRWVIYPQPPSLTTTISSYITSWCTGNYVSTPSFTAAPKRESI